MRGYKAGRFSFNVKGGRCEACEGQGQLQIEMQFLPDIYVPCEVCHGARYNRETLQVRYKGKNIAEVLDMTVDEALEFFAAIPAMPRKLKTLQDVGLGYIRLGQPAPTLSGGEAQRVKLAASCASAPPGSTLYVLDEPSVGLHAADVHRLIEVLQTLVDAGQHGGDHRAPSRHHQGGRLGDRPGPGGRRRAAARSWPRARRRQIAPRRLVHRAVPEGAFAGGVGAAEVPISGRGEACFAPTLLPYPSPLPLAPTRGRGSHGPGPSEADWIRCTGAGGRARSMSG